jgi:hypothetical protein
MSLSHRGRGAHHCVTHSQPQSLRVASSQVPCSNGGKGMLAGKCKGQHAGVMSARAAQATWRLRRPMIRAHWQQACGSRF